MGANDLLSYAFSESSLKTSIIEILTVKWPLPVNEIHKAVPTGKSGKVSYQAVRKALNQLLSEGCLVISDKKYQINTEWIKNLSNQVKQIEANYQGKFVFQQTIFEKEGSKVNVLVAKDGIVRDTLREEVLIQLLKELIPICREEFGPHNIFSKDEDYIIDYLLNVQKEKEILVFLHGDKVIGGTVFEKKDESISEDHTVWKLKHFALSKGLPKDVERGVMDEIEERLMKKSKSIKIQLNLSEKEERAIERFQRFGFTLEGTLKDHYRVGENMYIYSKVYSR